MKYNSKVYEGKDRIYKTVPGTAGIQRLHQWNGSEYIASKYEARKYDDMKKRVKRVFDTLAEAKQWQQGNQIEIVAEKGMNFGEVINEWQKRMFPTLSEGTRLQYEKLVRLYISRLANLGIYELTPQKIDHWIDGLKVEIPKSVNSKNRKSFDHELACLCTILRYFENYYDDVKFRFPIKDRHRQAIKLSVKSKVVSKDLTHSEFELFLEQFVFIRNGSMFSQLARVQFYQALRVSEVAAIHWEDLVFDENKPSNSRLKITRSAFWPRRAGMKSGVKAGFKNSEAMNGMKEQPMFPQTFDTLISIKPKTAKGLVFTLDGTVLEYRHIQHAYNRAFKLAGLNYSATHIMRHGGTRRLFNENGDLSVAQQILGNTDINSTMVYAKRSARALTEVSDRHWSQLVAKAE